MARAAAVSLLAILGLALPGAASGQGFRPAPFAQPELRIESVASVSAAVMAGAGLNVPAGSYVRIAPMVAAGREVRSGGRQVARAEVVARFLADPFHETRWGLYGGGGIAALWTQGEEGRGALVLVAGIDFPGRTAWRPVLEVGIGGGVRIALALRPPRRAGR